MITIISQICVGIILPVSISIFCLTWSVIIIYECVKDKKDEEENGGLKGVDEMSVKRFEEYTNRQGQSYSQIGLWQEADRQRKERDIEIIEKDISCRCGNCKSCIIRHDLIKAIQEDE